MAFKFNPITGELDLVNASSRGNSNDVFDPTNTIDLVSTTKQTAIEELDQQFSPNVIPTGKKITVKLNRVLVTSPFLKLESNSQLVIYGRVIII